MESGAAGAPEGSRAAPNGGAADSAGGASSYPTRYEIDYVRVHQKN
jgi:hypothetical protein